MSTTTTMSLPACNAAPATGIAAVLRALYQAWLRAYGRGEATCGH